MLKLVTSHEPIFRVASKTESMGHISVPPLCIVISSLPTIHRARMNILEPLAKLTRVQGEHSRTNMQHFLLVMGVFFIFFSFRIFELEKAQNLADMRSGLAV